MFYGASMQFPASLEQVRLHRRYKRFLADVERADGTIVTAHCPNPGAMMGLTTKGARAFVSPAASPARKLAFTLELVEADATLVGINTQWPNRLAEEAIQKGTIAELQPARPLRREVAYGKASRIDLMQEGKDGTRTYIEVKNVHLRRTPGLAEFPDCITARGTKHLEELAEMAAAGHRAVQLFIVQRADCQRFAIADDIDPAYATAFGRARQRGVEMLVYDCDVRPDGIDVRQRLELAS